MVRSKKIYKPLRNRHGEGKRRYTTIGLNDEVACEFKMVVNAYCEVYGKMTPAQVIKRLIDAGLKRCDPEVYDVLTRRTEESTPEPVLEIIHLVEPTEGEVWEMSYFFEKDGEQLEAKLSNDGSSFSAKLNNRFVGIKELLKKGWTFINDAGIEINEDQAKIIAQKIKKHMEDEERKKYFEIINKTI